MTTRTTDTTFQFHPAASPLRVGARLLILVGLCAALFVGFVNGLTTSSGDDAGRVAASAARCGSRAC